MNEEPARWPWGLHDLAPRPSLPQLLAHAQRNYSDASVALDGDALVDAATSDEDRAALRRYMRLRRSAPGFRPRDFHANNHGAIPLEALESLAAATSAPLELRRRVCESCHVSFVYRRSTARYCSERCAKRAQRAA